MNRLTPCGLSESELMRSLMNPKISEAAQLVAHIRNAGGTIRLTESGASLALPRSSMSGYFVNRFAELGDEIAEFLKMGEEETG